MNFGLYSAKCLIRGNLNESAFLGVLLAPVLGARFH